MFPIRYYPTKFYAGNYFPPVSGDTGVIVSISDSVSVADAVATQAQYARVLSDTAGITDATESLIVLLRTVSDSVGVSDSEENRADYSRLVMDIMTPQDAVSRVYTGRVALFDTTGITDLLSKGQFRTLADEVASQDAIATSREIALLLQDTSGASDSTSDVAEFIRSLTDLLGIDETLVANLISVNRSQFDAVGITDSVSAAFLLSLLLEESVGISDSVIAFLRQTDIPCIINLEEVGQSSIVDAINGVGPYVRTAAGILVPSVSGSDAETGPSVTSVEGESTPEITGQGTEGDCND